MKRTQCYSGTIRSLKGSWGSGLATLVVEDDSGVAHSIPCENAPTVRALDAMFGDVIGPDHCVRPGSLAGRRITCYLDESNLILGAISFPGDEEADA